VWCQFAFCKIDENLKQDAYQKLSKNNRLGGDLSYNFNVEIPLDTFLGKPNFSLYAGVKDVTHLDAIFSSDLFRFTFSGNKQFAGKTADISNTQVNYFKYKQVNIGLISYSKSKNKTKKEGIILSLIKGEQHQAISVPRGSIFTEQDGKQINLDLEYTYNSSDTSKRNAFDFNGLGISSKIFTQFIINEKSHINLEINDLGFIHWSSQSLVQSTDSSFQYKGIFINNIFNLNDSILSSLSKDSLINNITTSHQKKSYAIALPTSINLSYVKIINSNWKLEGAIYHQFLSNYFPYFYVNTFYYFNPSTALKLHLGYGGYGLFKTGLTFSKSLFNKINIIVGSNNVLAYITPKSAYSNSGFVGLKAYF